MYRELASVGKVFGIRGGPYAGKPRRVELHKLPASVRERLSRAIHGSGLPHPILRTSEPARYSLWLPLIVIAAVAAAITAREDFGAVGRPYQGPLFFFAYGAAFAIVVSGAVAIGRRMRRGPLAQGVYLFPLDIVEIDRTTMTVRPMGGLRRVTIELVGGNKTRLELTFEDDARYAFPCRDEAHAEKTYEALERAQDQIESLTLTKDLGDALDADPFFGVRVGDGSAEAELRWRALAPDAPSTTARRTAAFSFVPPLVGVAVGLGAFVARNAFSDDMAYEAARTENTSISLGTYLGAGGRRHRDQARAKLAELQAREASLHETDVLQKQMHDDQNKDAIWKSADIDLTPEQRAKAAALARTSLEAYEPIKAKDPSVEKRLNGLLARGSATGDRALSVRFTRSLKDTTPAADPGRAWFEGAALNGFQDIAFRALRKVFGQTFSPLVLDLKQTTSDPDLAIVYQVKRASDLDVEVVFDVSFAMAEGKPVTFHLTMPRPKDTPKLRPGSLYRTTDRGPVVDLCERIAARAFDRLYDELYGLFFSGPIRVPVAVPSASAPAH